MPTSSDAPPAASDTASAVAEARLRHPFSSPDYSRILNAPPEVPGGDPPAARELVALASAWDKVAKPIRLRALVALLGMDGGRRLAAPLLEAAEGDGDEWVRMISGVVRWKLLPEKDWGDTSGGGDIDKNGEGAAPGDYARSVLDKTVEEVLRISQRAVRVGEDARGAPSEPAPFHHCLLGSTYAVRLRPDKGGGAASGHFVPDMKAAFLMDDVRMEEERQAAAEELEKVAIKRVTSKGGTAVGRGEGTATDTRPRTTAPGRGHACPTRPAASGARPAAGRTSTAYRPGVRPGRIMTTGRGSVLGRGRVAAAIGGTGQGRRLGAGVKRAGGPVGGAVRRTAAGRGGAAGGRGGRTMMMMDTAEETKKRVVLARVSEERGRQDEKNVEKGTKRRKGMNAADNGDTSTFPTPTTSVSALASSEATPTAVTSAPPPDPSSEGWRSLLVQSNVLSQEDKTRIEQFFTTKTNPTPDRKTFRIKLHQEKRTDENGGVVRETLYLELDYGTFGYKKLRSIKKK